MRKAERTHAVPLAFESSHHTSEVNDPLTAPIEQR